MSELGSVQLGKVRLGSVRVGKCLVGKCPSWEVSGWVMSGLGNVRLGNVRLGNVRWEMSGWEMSQHQKIYNIHQLNLLGGPYFFTYLETELFFEMKKAIFSLRLMLLCSFYISSRTNQL